MAPLRAPYPSCTQRPARSLPRSVPNPHRGQHPHLTVQPVPAHTRPRPRRRNHQTPQTLAQQPHLPSLWAHHKNQPRGTASRPVDRSVFPIHHPELRSRSMVGRRMARTARLRRRHAKNARRSRCARQGRLGIRARPRTSFHGPLLHP